jgi:hypothetical protein
MRQYYYNHDRSKCVTVWEKPGGTVYIIPGKYDDLSLPSKNYVSTDNRNIFLIVWNKPEDYFFTITWRNGYPVEIKLPDYKCQKLDRSNSSERTRFYALFTTSDDKMRDSLDYFELDWSR